MANSDVIEASETFGIQQGIQEAQRLFGETNIIEECYYTSECRRRCRSASSLVCLIKTNGRLGAVRRHLGSPEKTKLSRKFILQERTHTLLFLKHGDMY